MMHGDLHRQCLGHRHGILLWLGSVLVSVVIRLKLHRGGNPKP